MRIPADLLTSARTGDPKAIERLLAAAQPDVRRYARRQCHRGSVIEDVVQETLMVLWRRVGSVRDPAAFGGWLITVVKRLCMMPALMLMHGVEEIDDAVMSRATAHIPADDLRIDLARAFESLPQAQREIVLLRDFEDRSLAEIALQLGLTLEATKSRLHRARRSLREYLLAQEGAK